MSLHIETMDPIDVTTDKGNVCPTPKSAAVMLPGISDGRSTCLLEYCTDIKHGCPKTVLFSTTTVAVSDKTRGRICNYSENVTEIVPQPKPKDQKQKCEPGGIPLQKTKRNVPDYFPEYRRLFYSDEEGGDLS